MKVFSTKLLLIVILGALALIFSGCTNGGSGSNDSSDTNPPTTTASPPGGTYHSATSVTLAANEAATIYYTTDGSEPTSSSAQYSAPIVISTVGPTQLRFFAVDSAGNEESPKKQEDYIMEGMFALAPGVNNPTHLNISPFDTNVEMMQLLIEDSMATVLSDDMEGGASGWTADSPWAQITSACHSGTTCWTDSPTGNYDNDLDISLTSTEFSLESLTGATLTFLHRYDMEEDCDYGYVEISTNGGASWTNLGSFTGFQSIWTKAVIDLSSYVGNSSVKIRFRLLTDGDLGVDGWYVDDVHIQGPTGGTSIEDTRITSITFTASGTGDEVDDISSVGLYRDANNNGIHDVGDTLIGTETFSFDDGTLAFSGLSEVKSAGTPQNWLVVYDFSGNASDGETFSISLAANNDVTATGIDSNQPITPAGLPVSGSTRAVGWAVETIDSASAGSNYRTSIALDSNNRPHIAYQHWTNNNLSYAYFDGAAWQIETVDSTPWVGWDPSLALDINDRPHISYFASNGLNYAYFDGAAWQIETIDNPGGGRVGEYTSLALDTNDRPQISYYDRINGDLKYAHYDGADWQIETVDSAGDVGYFTSIALDTNDRPHISYCDYGNLDLKYAYYDGADWQIETVDSEGEVGWYASLALDTNDRPHIGYWDNTNRDLKYAYYDGADWQIETVDSAGEVGWYASLALDTNNRPHIAYTSEPENDVKYAHFDGATWQIETVDSFGTSFDRRHTSIALDSNDRPHIGYSIPLNSLRYAHK